MTGRSSKPARAARVRLSAQIEPTGRDIDVLALLGLCGCATSAQVARALFPSEDRARRRLRRLFDAGLVNVAVTGSNCPNLVSLTRRGLRFAENQLPDLAGRLRLCGPVQIASLNHRLAVVDARLYCAALGEARKEPLVRWANGGGAFAVEIGLADWRVEPDGLAEFATVGGPVVVAIEVDCGTEPVRSVIADKLERYCGGAENGVLDALWFVVMTSSRQETITQALLEHGLEHCSRALLIDEINNRPVREPAGMRAAAGTRARGPNMPAAVTAGSQR